jgi:uncharacterized protein (TIGR03086 family)
MGVLDDFDRTRAEVEHLVANTEAERFRDSTPCADWDVRALLNHLIYVNLRYAALLRGESPPEGTADHVGDDHVAGFRASAAVARAAFSDEERLELLHDSPVGRVPGTMFVQHVVNELLVHGWDLARATGQPTDLAPDVAERSLASWRNWLGTMPRPTGGPFASEQPVPEGASAADRLAAYLGRAV